MSAIAMPASSAQPGEQSPANKSPSDATTSNTQRRKGQRWSIPQETLDGLTSAYERDPWPNPLMRQELAEELGCSARQVQVWFQNRRQRVGEPTPPKPSEGIKVEIVAWSKNNWTTLNVEGKEAAVVEAMRAKPARAMPRARGGTMWCENVVLGKSSTVATVGSAAAAVPELPTAFTSTTTPTTTMMAAAAPSRTPPKKPITLSTANFYAIGQDGWKAEARALRPLMPQMMTIVQPPSAATLPPASPPAVPRPAPSASPRSPPATKLKHAAQRRQLGPYARDDAKPCKRGAEGGGSCMSGGLRRGDACTHAGEAMPACMSGPRRGEEEEDLGISFMGVDDLELINVPSMAPGMAAEGAAEPDDFLHLNTEDLMILGLHPMEAELAEIAADHIGLSELTGDHVGLSELTGDRIGLLDMVAMT